jgi:hypothetical protein
MASRSSILTVWVCVALISACGDDGPAAEGTESESGDGDTGDGDGDPGDGDGDTTGDGDGDTTGDGDGETGDGDGDGDSGDGDGDGDPGNCDEPGTASVSFSLDATDFDSMVDWDLFCTSGGVQTELESGYQVVLNDCVEVNGHVVPADMILDLQSNPDTMPNVPFDLGVRLHWVQTPPFISGKWFTLHTEPGGSLLLAGLDGAALLPWDAPTFSYEPLGIELVSIGCTPYEHDSGCGFAERIAFELTYDGDTDTISDRNSGYVGQLTSYEAIVGSALDFGQPTCDDFPNQILRALFFQIPEG